MIWAWDCWCRSSPVGVFDLAEVVVPAKGVGPSAWMLENADLLPRGGRVLDVACGRGRHALLLASAGFDVRAIDRDPEAIAFVRDTAARLGLRIDAEVVDLETDPPPDIPWSSTRLSSSTTCIVR